MPESRDPDAQLLYFITTEQAITSSPTNLVWSRTNDVQTYTVLDLSEWQDWVIMLENAAGGSGAALSACDVYAGPAGTEAKTIIDVASEKSTLETACATLAANAVGVAFSTWNGSIPYYRVSCTADTSDTTILGWVYGRR